MGPEGMHFGPEGMMMQFGEGMFGPEGMMGPEGFGHEGMMGPEGFGPHGMFGPALQLTPEGVTWRQSGSLVPGSTKPASLYQEESVRRLMATLTVLTAAFKSTAVPAMLGQTDRARVLGTVT